MRLPGAGLLLRGLCLSVFLFSPAEAIDLDISDERMYSASGVMLTLADSFFTKQNRSKMPPAQPCML